MKTFTIIASLLLLTHQTLSQNQNLCRDSAALGRVFADDPSSCHRYLWCDPERITHTIDCRNGNPQFPFFSEDFCVATNNHCTPLTNLCPPTGQPDILIAVDGDETCTFFRPCRLVGFPPLECSTGTRFDRNTGLCISEERVPCIYDDAPLFSCNGLADGMNSVPGSCTKFVFCFGGEIILENECEPDYYFHRTELRCVLGTCEYNPIKSENDFLNILRNKKF